MYILNLRWVEVLAMMIENSDTNIIGNSLFSLFS